MKKRIIFGLMMCMLLSCTAEKIADNSASVTFYMGMEAQTRAPQLLNTSAYAARLYLYKKHVVDGVTGYQMDKQVDVESNYMTLDGLESGAEYKAVFMAIPTSQTPVLPDYSGSAPAYAAATAEYIDAAQTESNIFRDIVDFKAISADAVQTAVLTRQNGALEVRIYGIRNLEKVELDLEGHTTMFIQDGAGRQVIVNEDVEHLHKTIDDAAVLAASDIRIKINLLPVEDITDLSGTKNFLTLTYSDGTPTVVYPIKSKSGAIPIYPNQVTWLTLGSKGSGYEETFTVSFSEDGINLDDDKWDGWNPEY